MIPAINKKSTIEFNARKEPPVGAQNDYRLVSHSSFFMGYVPIFFDKNRWNLVGVPDHVWQEWGMNKQAITQIRMSEAAICKWLIYYQGI